MEASGTSVPRTRGKNGQAHRTAAACHLPRLELDPDDRAAIPALARVRMLALMHLVRAFEERVLDLKEADLVHGPAHTSVGQEAVAAAWPWRCARPT